MKRTILVLMSAAVAVHAVQSGARASGSPAAPSVYYVSPSGEDVAPGTEGSPFKSLKKATRMLRAGDTLYLLPGVYTEEADLKASGLPGAPITIEAKGRAVIDGSKLPYYTPAFDTHGRDHLRFVNLEVRGARAGVQVSAGSEHIEIVGLRTRRCQFAVKIADASHVSVRGAFAIHARNAFRAEGKSSHLEFENVRALYSKDIYEGYNRNYLNGDGFILEGGVSDVVIRDTVSAGHWDAGFDVKASRVLLENVVAFGNKNGLKLWGKDIRVENATIFRNRRQKTPDGGAVDGNGINQREGTALVRNATLTDNDDIDVKLGTPKATLKLEDSLVARRGAGKLFYNHDGRFKAKNVRWFQEGKTDAKAAGVPKAGGTWTTHSFAPWDPSEFRPASGG